MKQGELQKVFREIVLASGGLPEALCGNSLERRAFLTTNFPHLSDALLERIITLSTTEIHSYERSVLRAQVSLLQTVYPMTVLLTERAWSSPTLEPYSLLAIVNRLLRGREVSSQSPFSAIDQFSSFVAHQIPGVVARAPALPDLARFELINARVRGASDELISETQGKEEVRTADDSALAAQLAAMPVEELLATVVRVPSSLACVRFNHDVVTALHYFHAHDRALPTVIDEVPIRCLASQDLQGHVQWFVVGEQVFLLMGERARIGTLVLAELAEACLADTAAASVGDEARYTAFLEFVGVLASGGALILPALALLKKVAN